MMSRTVANQEWSDLFPQAQAAYLQKVSSDHSPLLNSCMGELWKKWTGFKYDQRWVQRPGFVDHIKQFWKRTFPGQGGNMMEQIALCRKEISTWKRRNKPNSAARIQELSYKIDMATRQNPVNQGELHVLKGELRNEYRMEEIYWKQKSRLTWLNNGDRNTKIFHATTKHRRAQNRIQCLIDEEENEWLAEKDLGRVAEDYFKKMYTSEDVGYKLKEMTGLIPPVDERMNDILMAPVSMEEVKRAVFDINPHKSPGPDGMT